MSTQPLPTPISQPRYDAVPTPNDNISPAPSPRMETFELPQEVGGLPTGAGQPRFLGRALYDDPSHPNPRDSYASSHNTYPSVTGDSYSDSVYALNNQRNADGTMRDSSYGSYRDDPRDEFYAGQPGSLAMSPVGGANTRMEEKRAAYAAPKTKSRRKMIIAAVIAAIILLVLAIAIPVYFTTHKNNKNAAVTDGSSDGDNDSSSSDSKGDDGKGTKNAIVTGGDGSEVTLDDGSKMTYTNKHGGTWYYDEKDPFNNNAQAQSWTPALNATFKYGTDKIRGVNLGGWLNTEPFIVPALYEKYHGNPTPPVDEWGLSEAMRADEAGGGINQMEDHYKTFITEKDFAEIAAAGLNYVRIPIGWWAIETRDKEPFLAKTSWTYFLKAIKWARKYGIRINLDLHAVPGSQNGWNHSGRLGDANFLNGPMGLANAQRALDYIRIIAEFISQPQYSDVVTMFGILNEPQSSIMGADNLSRFYLQAYNIVRKASGTGEGKGPFLSFHEGFRGRSNWDGFMEGADRISLDTHPYLCFNGQSADPISAYATRPCDAWAKDVNNSMAGFGLNNAGEFSNAVTDCGLWLNGVDLGTRYEGTYAGDWPRIGSCDPWNDWTKYSDKTKKDIKQFALASMDALQNYFFWTWKIGNSTVSGRVDAPDWSYQLGLENGWMPTDPREADGTCGNTSPWDGPLKPWQTGGAGAGNMAAAVTNALVWPPTVISHAGDAAALPTYTATGDIITLPAPTFTQSVDSGSGWANKDDSEKMAVNPSGCPYIDPWIGEDAAVPALCTGKKKRMEAKRVPAPVITTPPRP